MPWCLYLVVHASMRERACMCALMHVCVCTCTYVSVCVCVLILEWAWLLDTHTFITTDLPHARLNPRCLETKCCVLTRQETLHFTVEENRGSENLPAAPGPHSWVHLRLPHLLSVFPLCTSRAWCRGSGWGVGRLQ